MSDDRARFGLELLDKVSGPAEKIIGGLEGATGALSKLSSTSGAASDGMTKVGKAVEYMTFALRGIQIAHGVVELSKALGGFEKLKGGIKATGLALRRFGVWAAQGLKRVAPFAAGGAGLYGLGKIAGAVTVPAMGLTAGAIGAVGIAAAGATLAVGYLGLKLAGLAVDGVKATAEFATFGQNSRMAFSALAKYGASGAKLFEHAKNLAAEYGQDVQDTSNNFKKLLAGGFAPRLATDIIKMGADMRFLGSSAEEVKGAVRAISQIKAAGRLQGDELNQLAEAGIGASAVYEALGKRLGKTVPEVMKLKEAGKIDASTAISGILDAVLKTTGGTELGQRGKEWADHAIDGMVGRLKSRGQVWMSALGDSLAPTLSRLAHGAMEWTEEFMRSGRAEALLSKIGDTFSAVGDVLTKVVPLVGEFLDGFGSEATTAFGNLSDAVTAFGGTDGVSAAENFGAMGRALAQIVIYGGAAAAAFVGLMAAGTDGIKGALSAFIGFPIQAVSIGYDVALGFARGIKNGISAVGEAIGELGTSAVNKLRGLLSIRSPSRVFGQLGGFTAAGFALGIAANAGQAADASGAMAEAAARAAEVPMYAPAPTAPATEAPSYAPVTPAADMGAFAPARMLARAGMSITIGDVIVQVGAGADGAEIGRATGRSLRRELDDWLAEMDEEA